MNTAKIVKDKRTEYVKESIKDIMKQMAVIEMDPCIYSIVWPDICIKEKYAKGEERLTSWENADTPDDMFTITFRDTPKDIIEVNFGAELGGWQVFEVCLEITEDDFWFSTEINACGSHHGSDDEDIQYCIEHLKERSEFYKNVSNDMQIFLDKDNLNTIVETCRKAYREISC